MTIAVAHHRSAHWQSTVQEAAREAKRRQTSLVVIHVAEGVDVDLNREQQALLNEEIADALGEAGLQEISWTLRLTTGEDVAEAVLDAAADEDVELLVIGARRRTPVGKLLMGSVTQSIILRAQIPVLVLKPPTER
ncbi:MAG TPA: universal stress protein [Propionibacteriaceae bacterium]